MPFSNDRWSCFDYPDARRAVLDAQVGGVAYEIRVWCPAEFAAGGKLPVVYALDGEGLLGTLAEAIARTARRPDATRVAPAIVVAISRANREDGGGRHADFTPGPAAEEPTVGQITGGADRFVDFIEHELVPVIERDFPADPARRVLLGHSLAGFFVLYASTVRPALFSTYVAISPSIWWDEAKLRSGMAGLPATEARIFIAVGEWEGELPPWQRSRPDAAPVTARRAQRAMIERAERTAAALRALIGSERVELHVLPDEDHASVVLVATARALRFALRPV